MQGGAMKYRRKGFVDAVQWTGKNMQEVKAFAAQFAMFDYADMNGDGAMDAVLKVKTHEKIVPASVGDYIVRGQKGDFFIEKKADFERDWEQA